MIRSLSCLSIIRMHSCFLPFVCMCFPFILNASPVKVTCFEMDHNGQCRKRTRHNGRISMTFILDSVRKANVAWTSERTQQQTIKRILSQSKTGEVVKNTKPIIKVIRDKSVKVQTNKQTNKAKCFSSLLCQSSN